MREHELLHRLIWGLASGLLVAAPLASGCDLLREELSRRCNDAERSYRQSLSEERTELEAPENLPNRDKRPAHFGLTLSNELLTDLANVAVEPLLEAALQVASTVEVQGQSVDVETEGDVIDLALAADGACDHCFRLRTELGGGLVADIPSIGRERANLDGSFQFVAPLFLAPGDDKSVAVKLDLETFTQYAATKFSPGIAGVSDPWERLLREPLSRLLRNSVEQQFGEAVTLLEFNGPSFGIDGFELTPVVLQSDDRHDSVFAGFAANIAALNEETVPGVPPITSLAPDQNIALSFQPKLILHVLSLLITGEDVARRYTSSGRADSGGPFHVTLDTFRPRRPRDGPASGGAQSTADAGEGTDTPVTDAGSTDSSRAGSAPFGLGFTVHRFRGRGFCFSAGARAVGDAAVDQGALSIGVSDVQFTGEGVPPGVVDIANWTTAQFVQETESLVQKSIDGENLEVPGTSLGVGPVAFGLSPNAFVLRGRSTIKNTSGNE